MCSCSLSDDVTLFEHWSISLFAFFFAFFETILLFPRINGGSWGGYSFSTFLILCGLYFFFLRFLMRYENRVVSFCFELLSFALFLLLGRKFFFLSSLRLSWYACGFLHLESHSAAGGMGILMGGWDALIEACLLLLLRLCIILGMDGWKLAGGMQIWGRMDGKDGRQVHTLYILV